ncbi:zona pellucida sperm-binding protein 4-like isoform X1 [Scleropages formosus]|uniref:zona pellucida sperm-binding protein 4-like isoform X1 n=1 Tax=Scleropages formosus TaxID=113540 RepID=UPI0010FAA8F9|nr:zona pellucida sperm-binding protein 4-like isoform X1 [Scleropages formosus]XP_029104377.1 zona pellucida sperm-binding protein 4-like isoform X1 [Scleropages formosus]XP_029104379.1 zona pellucida sperm-binding protein 4-like isoform X1 [Scleropages formosus]XP_029104381.1 zona pellucida sperm-binding protein 4-like isoform X1 [Scleropages formosus]XP_029104383.1 zona pellucida sperm-binding protein 4-like isoform X1 [Scleropages formosus]
MAQWLWCEGTFLAVLVATVVAQKAMPPDPIINLMSTDTKCQMLEKVPCGFLGISPENCEAIGCCFDGQQCYYGNVVTVQCTRDGQFVVVVSKDSTVPQLDLTTISTLGGNEVPCSPVVSTGSFVIYNFPVTTCGTVATMAGDYLIYENKMTSSYEVGVGPLGSITRDSTFELLFQCKYLGSELVSLMADVYTVAPPPPVAAPGPLRVELRLANGQCNTKGCDEEVSAYSSYYEDSDYPVTKVLRQPVYVEVRILGRTDPNIVLLLENCWATSTPDPLGVPQWNLIVNGCPYQGDKYLTALVPVDGSSGLSFPTHYKRFIFKMFTFVDPASLHHLEQKVFIHCSTAVCHPSATDNCEQRCFRKRRDVGAVQKTSNQTRIIVSSYEVIMTAEIAKPVMMQSKGEGPRSIAYGTLAVVVSAVLGVFVSVLVVVRRLCRRRRERCDSSQ